MFRNREGRSVDPVPFIVVSGLSLMGCYSFFPVYCLTLGLPLSASIGLTTVIFAAIAAAAYHQLVWTARPDLRAEVPAGLRLETFFYVALAVTGVLLLLTLTLLAR